MASSRIGDRAHEISFRPRKYKMENRESPTPTDPYPSPRSCDWCKPCVPRISNSQTNRSGRKVGRSNGDSSMCHGSPPHEPLYKASVNPAQNAEIISHPRKKKERAREKIRRKMGARRGAPLPVAPRRAAAAAGEPFRCGRRRCPVNYSFVSRSWINDHLAAHEYVPRHSHSRFCCLI
jgi:hypothetical protein